MIKTWTLFCLLFAACGGVDEGDDYDGNGNGNGNGGGSGGGAPADCHSTASDVAADVQSAIATTCDVAVDCGAWTCDDCVSSFESSYRSLDSYSQATYADAVLCLSTIECADWLNADFTECTGNECGGVWCGGDDSVCQSNGCGLCQSDGYCG